ncbi:MAG: hypothetical protein HYU34_04855, partial [Candidatus Omnitrophica bacterium]|nr:hypothetical protein [Candidatus Omnitrophota bacterium]
MNAFYRPDKPLAVKLLSVFVIVSFLLTQFDIQLAFAYPVSAPAALSPTGKISPDSGHTEDSVRKDLEDIHYMQDLGEAPREAPPLAPPEEKPADEQGKKEDKDKQEAQALKAPVSFFEPKPIEKEKPLPEQKEGEVEEKESEPGEEAPFVYDETEARSFEYALALLSQDGVAVAAVVEGLTEENFRQLLTLKKEVGILVLSGETVLFTTSDASELKILKSVGELAMNADFTAHTHPVKATGPSDADVANAGEKIEYVITPQKVFGYNRYGLLFQESYAFLLEEIQAALQESGREGGKDAAEARSALHQFIRAMDEYANAAEASRSLFRAGTLAGPEENSFLLAETALRSFVALSDLVAERIEISPAETDRFRVVLGHGADRYEYVVNPATGEAALALRRTVMSGGVRVVEEYDSTGKIVRILEEDGGKALSVFFYDEAKNQVAKVNLQNRTLEVFTLEAGGKKAGALLGNGFYDDSARNYSLQSVADNKVSHFSYGGDGLLFTADDQSIPRPEAPAVARRQDLSSITQPAAGGGGSATRIENEVQKLQDLIIDYSECAKDGRKRKSGACQDLLDQIDALQRSIENIAAASAVSGPGGGEGGQGPAVATETGAVTSTAASPVTVTPVETAGSVEIPSVPTVVRDVRPVEAARIPSFIHQIALSDTLSRIVEYSDESYSTIVGRREIEALPDGTSRITTDLDESFNPTRLSQFLDQKEISEGVTRIIKYKDVSFLEVDATSLTQVLPDGTSRITTNVTESGQATEQSEFIDQLALEGTEALVVTYYKDGNFQILDSRNRLETLASGATRIVTEASETGAATGESDFIDQLTLSDGAL